MEDYLEIKGFSFLEGDRKKIVGIVSGRWLLERCVMSWRKEDLVKGFQRKLNEKRLRNIASKVLDSQRSFPNAIILSSKDDPFKEVDSKIHINNNSKFLIIDGQHRLYAQEYSDFEAMYICVFHVGFTEREMAYLFKEINDSQKRVPSSLRWDLVRLIETDENLPDKRAVDILFHLVLEDEESPIYQRVDMTGEISNIELKQGSIAPEFAKLIKSRKRFGKIDDYELEKDILKFFFIAMRDFDLKSWNDRSTIFNRNRTVRAALQLLNLILDDLATDPSNINPSHFLPYFNKLNPELYTNDALIAIQGHAGINTIKELMKKDMGI